MPRFPIATLRPHRARRATAAAALACAVVLAGAGPAQARDRRREAPPTLAGTGLYADAARHAVAPGNLPYQPQYPLWTDGAGKRRWIHLPRGTWIDARRPDHWVFPTGTKLWKEFSFGRRVETRYMERQADGSWLYATYRWTEDEREAVLAPAAGIRGAAEIRPGVWHDVPAVADCVACHRGRAVEVLGVDALQLSPDRDPLAPHAIAPSPGEVDLPALVARGLLRGLPRALLDRPPRIAARSPRERAALGYLHGNCASCHSRTGALASLGMILEHDLAATSAEAEPALATTAGRASRFALPGAAPGATERLVPGAPGRSAVLHRIASRSPWAQMPPFGSQLVDEEAVTLLAGWIGEDLRRSEVTPRQRHLTKSEEESTR